jgi:hypothetical protein
MLSLSCRKTNLSIDDEFSNYSGRVQAGLTDGKDIAVSFGVWE